MSASSDKSVYRAGVEALVKEACPERVDEIDDMMVEFDGREEILIGQLSTMLAQKHRESMNGEIMTDDATDDNFGTVTNLELANDYNGSDLLGSLADSDSGDDEEELNIGTVDSTAAEGAVAAAAAALKGPEDDAGNDHSMER